MLLTFIIFKTVSLTNKQIQTHECSTFGCKCRNAGVSQHLYVLTVPIKNCGFVSRQMKVCFSRVINRKKGKKKILWLGNVFFYTLLLLNERKEKSDIFSQYTLKELVRKLIEHIYKYINLFLYNLTQNHNCFPFHFKQLVSVTDVLLLTLLTLLMHMLLHYNIHCMTWKRTINNTVAYFFFVSFSPRK